MEQTAIDFKEGKRLRDAGIARAVTHAEDVDPGWQDKALSFLHKYAKSIHQFSGEQVREASVFAVKEPPSLRAWGSVLLKASKRGWIKKVGYVVVKNPNAHCTPASLWESCIYG